MKKIFIAIIFIVAIIVVGIFVFRPSGGINADLNILGQDANTGNNASDDAEAQGAGNGDQATDRVSGNTFSSGKYHFSITYPDGYKASISSDPDGNDTLIVQNSKSEGLQVRIEKMDTPVDAITESMIRNDIPNIVMNDSKNVTVGNVGKGVSFTSNNPAFGGNSREIWFAANGYFYQLSADMKYDDLVGNVIAGWVFGK